MPDFLFLPAYFQKQFEATFNKKVKNIAQEMKEEI